MKTYGNKFKGFTLVELLVVISIIAMLLSILMPALSKVREKGKMIVCGSRVHSLSTAIMMYSSDYGGRYPLAGSRTSFGGLWGAYPVAPYWDMRLLPYLGVSGVDMTNGEGTPYEGGENLGYCGKMLEIFACPSVRAYDKKGMALIDSKGWYPRTYRINAYFAGLVAREDGYFLTDKSYRNSEKQTSVRQPAQRILLTDSLVESSGVNTVWGSTARGWFDVTPAHSVEFDGPTSPGNDWGRVKSYGRSNFTFADGHVESKACQFTESYNRSAQGASYVDYEDPIPGIKFSLKYNW